jgi:hypothetical protein
MSFRACLAGRQACRESEKRREEKKKRITMINSLKKLRIKNIRLDENRF